MKEILYKEQRSFTPLFRYSQRCLLRLSPLIQQQQHDLKSYRLNGVILLKFCGMDVLLWATCLLTEDESSLHTEA